MLPFVHLLHLSICEPHAAICPFAQVQWPTRRAWLQFTKVRNRLRIARSSFAQGEFFRVSNCQFEQLREFRSHLYMFYGIYALNIYFDVHFMHQRVVYP
jgi:hypothetical protein